MNKYCLLLTVVLLSCNCQQKSGKPFPLPENAIQLLTADSSKTWKIARRFNNGYRMNMGDCFLSYRAFYDTNGNMGDNAGLNQDCGASLSAQWGFVKAENGHSYLKISSAQLPALMHINREFKFFKILNLSPEMLVLEYQHSQFNNKASTIRDILVPAGLNVADREFHL